MASRCGECKDQGSQRRGHRTHKSRSPKGEEKSEESSLSEMRLSQTGPLPWPPWGPSHTLGLSSGLYIPPRWTGAPAESPPTNSLRSPSSAQTSCQVRRDEDKPASGLQQDLYSHRTGAVVLGESATLPSSPSPCPEPDPPGTGLSRKLGGENTGAGGRLCTAPKGQSGQ